MAEPALGPALIEPFYRTLIDGLRRRGGAVRLVAHDRAQVADHVERQAGFHILDHGALRHPRALNCGVAYLYPFRNIDPWGIRAQVDASMRPIVLAAARGISLVFGASNCPPDSLTPAKPGFGS